MPISRDMITLSEAERRYGIPKPVLYRLAKQGRLTFVQFSPNGWILVNPKDIDRLVLESIHQGSRVGAGAGNAESNMAPPTEREGAISSHE